MDKRKPRKKTEACTAESLRPALPPVDTNAAIEHLLGALYLLALDGNLNAAKLYLDYRLKREPEGPAGLTAEDALRLLQEQASGK
jgi:hypothetical protein